MFTLPHACSRIVVASLACCWLTTVVRAEAVPAETASPNVLMIAIDDLNDWVGCLDGHPLVKTPHIDALAARGVLFSNAHCQAPLCNPSRTSIMLGLRTTTTGVYGLAPWFRTLPDWADRVTLPQHFHQNGYQTFTAGKVYHGGAGGPKQRLQEFDIWGPGGGVGVKPPHKLIPPTPMGNHPLMDWGTFPHEDHDKNEYQVTSWALDQLAKQKPGQPFFMAVGYSLPHVPLYVTPKWYDMYPDSDELLPPLLADDRADTPRFSWYLHWNLPEPRWSWIQQHHQARNITRSYLASTSFVDSQVGRLLAGLAEAGLKENTIVVLWSDHGYHLGEKAITGKNTLWERSTRVPLIFAGPGIPAGGRCAEPVELLDVYPTLIDLCRLPARTDLEGLSLRPQIAAPQTPRSRPAITTHNPGNHGIRSSRYRYIRYADGSEELYDLQSDPQEWKNLIARPEMEQVLTEHRRWLPKTEAVHAAGSQHRTLTYDPETDIATWEGQPVRRSDPVPE